MTSHPFGDAVIPEPRLAPETVVADTYEIDRLLGRGGMGEVWLARHRRLAGKQVAIKILHVEGNASLEAVARFRREAEIAARLEHPNIVQVSDFNTLPTGEPYLVMEWLKGVSLGTRLQSGGISLEDTFEIVRQVGSALQTAHSGGVVHRDLKPENIFLTQTSVGIQVKVLDFGISKLIDSQSLQTQEAVLLGTPLYMSPEQALGLNREVTGQSDIFSFASIVYEMLAGEPPYRADNIARILFRIAYESHVSLARLRPDLPQSVTVAIDHALQKDLALRTKDVATFVTELTGRPLASVPNLSSASSPQGETFRPDAVPTDSLLIADTRASGQQRPLSLRAEAPIAPTKPEPVVASTASSPPRKRWPLVLMALVVLAAAIVGVVLVVVPQPAGPSREVLHQFYTENEEPPAPSACQENDPRILEALRKAAPLLRDTLPEAQRLTQGQTALLALEPAAVGASTSAEARYLLLRAQLQAGINVSESLMAQSCPGFAAFENWAAKWAATKGKYDEATRRLQLARAADAHFTKPLLNQGIISFARGEFEQAIGPLEDYVAREPTRADGHYTLARVYDAHAQRAQASGNESLAQSTLLKANASFCRASSLGHPEAAARCRK